MLNLFVGSQASIYIQCDYQDFDSKPYTCEAKLLIFGNGTNILGVTQNHLNGLTNNDVLYLRSNDAVLEALPTRIEGFFPNLTLLRFDNAGIKRITKFNFRPFSELWFLSLKNNQLESLESDLFEYTPKLERIFLSSNNVVHIGLNILNSLKYLEVAYFESNICINSFAANATQIKRLKLELTAKCPPTIEMIKAEILLNITATNSQLMERLSQLESRIGQLERGNEIND